MTRENLKRTDTDRRGEWVAILGAVVSLLGFLMMAALGIASRGTSVTVWGTAFQLIGTVGIWFLCYIQLHQQRLLAEERLEIDDLERLRRDKLGGVETIFEEDDLDQMDSLAQGRRMRTIERFLLPVLGLLIAGFHLVAGFLLMDTKLQFAPLRDAPDVEGVVQAKMLVFFAGGMAFVTFMIARYALGMSRLSKWGALRAGGNFMFGSSLFSMAIAVALLCEISGIPVEAYVGYILCGGLLLWQGVETIVVYILDFYRPRVRDQAERPFYDSRLLGIFSEPGSIFDSISNTLDYQFGFRVSETWFYQLLRRQVLLLLLAQVAIIMLLTCFTIVPQGHQAVITHFGDVRSTTAKPGVHFTWPWPIDQATIIPVERIQRMVLGFDRKKEEAGGHHEKNPIAEDRAPILWTKKHYKEEYKLLVADRKTSADSKVPVNLLSMTMPVQWRVRPLSAEVIRFESQANETPGIIESLAYRELTRYAASADISDFLGAGGIAAAEQIKTRLQAACDSAGFDGGGLGVEIVYVGIGGVHPPQDDQVAETYQRVVSAIEQKDATIKVAEGSASKMKILSAGQEWETLFDLIVEEEKARQVGASDLEAKTEAVESFLLTRAGGVAREIAVVAERQAYAKLLGERAAAELYTTQSEAFDKAPASFAIRMYLETMMASVRDVQKYIVVLDDMSNVIYELDMKPDTATDVLAAEIKTMEEKNEL